MKNKLIYSIIIVFFCLSCAEEQQLRLADEPLKLGSKYLEGTIFYILQPGDPNYIEGEIHGFVVGADLKGEYTWSCIIPQNLGKKLGDGAHNTNVIAASCSTENAASICLQQGWYIPNGAAMQKLIHNRLIANITSADYYWVSHGPYGIRISDGDVIESCVTCLTPKKFKIKPIKRF